MTKPVLRWPGGKRRHLKTILPLIKPHECYVEPFAGGLAVLLAKPRSPVEIVNDSNWNIVALYRCAQFHLEALLREMEWQVAARVNFREFRENRGLTDLQRAARFLVGNLTSFGGAEVARDGRGVTFLGSRPFLRFLGGYKPRRWMRVARG